MFWVILSVTTVMCSIWFQIVIRIITVHLVFSIVSQYDFSSIVMRPLFGFLDYSTYSSHFILCQNFRSRSDKKGCGTNNKRGIKTIAWKESFIVVGLYVLNLIKELGLLLEWNRNFIKRCCPLCYIDDIPSLCVVNCKVQWHISKFRKLKWTHMLKTREEDLFWAKLLSENVPYWTTKMNSLFCFDEVSVLAYCMFMHTDGK